MQPADATNADTGVMLEPLPWQAKRIASSSESSFSK
jgi:hypothetical protein